MKLLGIWMSIYLEEKELNEHISSLQSYIQGRETFLFTRLNAVQPIWLAVLAHSITMDNNRVMALARRGLQYSPQGKEGSYIFHAFEIHATNWLHRLSSSDQRMSSKILPD